MSPGNKKVSALLCTFYSDYISGIVDLPWKFQVSLLSQFLSHAPVAPFIGGFDNTGTNITSTGYTYGALAIPIAFLLFAFFLGFAIMIGAELNAAIQEEWPAPDTHARRLREWLEEKADEVRNGNGDQEGAEQEGAGRDDAGQANVGAPPARPLSWRFTESNWSRSTYWGRASCPSE